MKQIASIILAALMSVAANVKNASAQTESRSLIYLGAGIEKEFSKKFTAEIDMQSRFCHAKESQEFLITPKIEYSPVKFVAFGTEYRAKLSHEKGESSEWSGRFGAWLKAKWSPSILKLEARIKYCNYTDDVQDRDGNYASEKYFRTKLLAGVKIKSIKLTPYISYEWFYEFNRSLVDKDRLTVGLKKKLNKRNALTFEYMFEERFNRGKTKKNINNHIFAFTYQYTFPYKKESE
jgi:hypothetical protein